MSRFGLYRVSRRVVDSLRNAGSSHTDLETSQQTNWQPVIIRGREREKSVIQNWQLAAGGHRVKSVTKKGLHHNQICNRFAQ